jgi:iron complex outermembrane receptor protein
MGMTSGGLIIEWNSITFQSSPTTPPPSVPATRLPLTLAIAIALAAPAVAAQAPEPPDRTHPHATELEEVEVTASPLRGAVDTLARPVEVLSGAELDDRKAATLGDTLARETGVQSASFGAGVGRPVIRGQEGARVQVLNGGTSSMDASTVSADHAVAIEPFLADQIEVLKGPATLLYGSGAIGGAVNVVDGRVPTARRGKPLSGRAELRHGTGADEGVGMVRLDGDAGAMTWHVDAFRRHAGDVRIPGFALSEHLREEQIAEGEVPEHFARGRLPNSALDTHGGAIGATWFGERAWFGAALSTYATDYGIPPGAHVHEHEHEEDEGGGPVSIAQEDEEAPPVRVDLRQHRLDARGGVRDVGPFREIGVRLSHSDYRHFELEGDEVGTRFDNDASEGRLEAVLAPRDGWRGAFGVQFGERDFAAVGEEAFLPPSVTRDVGVFALGEKDMDAVKVEFGARHDRVRVTLDGGATESRTASSASLAAIWRASEVVHLSLGIDRAQRAPTAEELFSDGPHVATLSHEHGDADLRAETARNVELGLHLHAARVEGKVSAYRVRFDDYIFLADTGEEIEELPGRQWTQAGARFRGWEAEATVTLRETDTGRTALRLFADRVHARLDNGDAVPRLAPGRFGADLAWESGGWRARVGAVRVARQDEVAPLEEPTPGYTLVDAHVAYHWDTATTGWEAFLDATNLTDREARAHTSFLKELAPLPGRAFAIGIRARF